jgi:hypothetical protein
MIGGSSVTRFLLRRKRMVSGSSILEIRRFDFFFQVNPWA